MNSFIVPRKKDTISLYTYLWILFIVLISFLLMGVGLYLDNENKKFEVYKSEYKKKIDSIKSVKEKIQVDIAQYKHIYILAKSSSSKNSSLKNGLQNLLSFVPDEIKINKMLLDRYEVKLYGTTDSPKTYKLLLEPPLKSIFDSSKVGFTKRDDGTYIFSSYNKLKRVKHEKR